MPYENHSPEDVETRGEEIYERNIRKKVEPEHKRKFVVIDIETSEYEIDEDDVEATRRALAKRPSEGFSSNPDTGPIAARKPPVR